MGAPRSSIARSVEDADRDDRRRLDQQEHAAWKAVDERAPDERLTSRAARRAGGAAASGR